MSTPVEPTLNQTISIASVDELVTQAKRLGLTWSLRPATVDSTLTPYSPTNPYVIMDGDDMGTGIVVTNLSTYVAVNMRVMVMFVPPVGNYIIGVISDADVRRREIGTLANHVTGLTTTEQVLDTFIQFKALPQAAYRVEMSGGLIAGTGVFATFRLRKTNTAGFTVISTASFQGEGLVQKPMYWSTYFANRTATTVQSDLVWTGATLSSVATWGGFTSLPRFISIQYAGPAVDYPAAAPIV